MTVNNDVEAMRDNWDSSKHTPLENTMAAVIKYLLARVVAPAEINEVMKMFPELWGNERRG